MDTNLEKAVAGFILCSFNIVLSLLCAFIFSAVDLVGYDASGAVVHNLEGSMYPMTVVYVVLIWINVMLMVYASYLFIRKPWVDVFGDETKTNYKGPSY